MKNYMNFKNFRKDTEKALEEVTKKYGINLKTANISYDNNTFTMQLKGERADVDIVKTKFDENLAYMRYYGFTDDDYRRAVTIENKNYIITGFKPGNKYDVCLEREDGKEYAYIHTAVLAALKRTA